MNDILLPMALSTLPILTGSISPCHFIYIAIKKK